ncbi:hypothetical protein K435DRAFT_879840 [Dendrothele bispora CBS 962.96]|uniref:Uncharacterized protein n=1 Tax=Dendrothele bispora (strain CBS 962.96) TaxID=1314807 RepID=A0A4S8KKG6_DENBC|nr:hypothetical protein K435DRAFT_879840 [Dendrothele bispora CBS 962.96]
MSKGILSSSQSPFIVDRKYCKYLDNSAQNWVLRFSQLTNGAWRKLTSDSSILGKRRRTSTPSPELDSIVHTGSSSPIGYGSDGEDEVEQDLKYAEDLARDLECAAGILRSQLPYKNQIWLKSIRRRRLGREIQDFVSDITEFESSRGTRKTTWADPKKKGDSRRVANKYDGV